MTLNPKALEWLESRAIEAETASHIATYTAKRGVAGARLDAEFVRSVFDYDPATGALTWRPRGNGSFDKRFAGKRAGTINPDGYTVVPFGGRTMLAGPVIWAWMTGAWPPEGIQVDHSNVVPNDDRWSNLRLATPSENTANRRRQSRNRSGFKGVSWDARRETWVASICFNGRQKRIGSRFESAEAAHAAYCVEAARLHGDFARVA